MLKVAKSVVIVKIVEKRCDSIHDLEEVPYTLEGRDLEILIVASIKTLKCNMKNVAKRKFYI